MMPPESPSSPPADSRELVLVTGATGYIGGRLVPLLVKAGYRVRCLVRDPARLEGRAWLSSVEVAQGDVLDPPSLESATRDVHSAFYLVHSMESGGAFRERDVEAAGNFSTAVARGGGKRIVYLGGLGDPDSELSLHLRSRHETGDALRSSGVPVTEFQAAVIVGAGSLSFEIVRYLTERLPVMIGPKWIATRIQPISTRNVLEYLVASLSTPGSVGETIGIGGADVLTYGEMMLAYARIRGLKRWLIPVPVLTPRLSSYWVHLVTPASSTVALSLIEGLRNEVVVRNDRARRLFPDIVPLDYEASVRLALEQLDAGTVESSWHDALSTTMSAQPVVTLTTREGLVREFRQRPVRATPATVFAAFSGLGGKRGWLSMNWAWQIRGWMDQWVGGVGMRRGRRHPNELRTGDAVDFWRVERVVQNRLLRLRAEMRVPGRAWMEFEVLPAESGGSMLSQVALFAPKGFFGWLYWYAVWPFHIFIFDGLIREVVSLAERMQIASAES